MTLVSKDSHQRAGHPPVPSLRKQECTATREAIDAFVAHHEAIQSSSNTVEHYRLLLNRLADTHKKLPTEPKPLEDFLSQWEGHTRRDYFKCLRTFHRWLAKQYDVTNPTDRMELPRVKRNVVDSLDAQELGMLLSQDFHLERDRTIIRTLIGNGLRVGELHNLNFRDIHDTTLSIQGKRGAKTGGRSVPLLPEIRDALLALKDGHSDDGPIFWGRLGKPLDVPGFQGIVKRAFAKAGIMGRRASPHTLRHTYSTHYLNQGGDLKSLKEILGHSDIKTTEGYTHLTKQDLIVKNARYNPLCHIPQGHPNISPTGASLSPVDENITW